MSNVEHLRQRVRELYEKHQFAFLAPDGDPVIAILTYVDFLEQSRALWQRNAMMNETARRDGPGPAP